MKKTVLATLLAVSTAFSAQAVETYKPDEEFIKQTSAMGITQANWDNGRSAKLTFKHAYRFTYSEKMSHGKFVHDLGQASGFDLSVLTGADIDGELPMDQMLRDRLNMESLVLLKDGKLVDEYYWSGMNKDQTHLMMSVTKSFTALTLSILAEQGLVDMNAPITKYVPELKSSPAYAQATVQQVADMRSGIKIEKTPGTIWDERMTIVQEWNAKPNNTGFNSIVDFGATLQQRPDVKVGEAFDYQCINTEMLGMVITHVTGKSVPEVMEELLWKRVGFENDAYLQTNSQGEAVASGGLNATTRDAARMMDVLVNGGKNRAGEQIISKAFINNLLAGNPEVKSAWKHDQFSALLADAWYKDQIRVLNVGENGEHRILVFVGIHGQNIIGEPATGKVIAMNGAQDEMQATRTVALTYLNAVPALLKAMK